MLKNSRFEDGWDNFPPTGDNLINQNPKEWTWRWVNIGDELWSSDVANGIPEMVHKHYTQLPEDERPGGANTLFPDGVGEYVYKPFHGNASFGVEGWQIITGLKPGSIASIVVPIRIHANRNKRDNEDPWLAESGVWLLTDWEINGREMDAKDGKGEWQNFSRIRQFPYIGGVKPDGWYWFRHGDPETADAKDNPGAKKIEVVVPESGEIAVLVRMKSKWDLPVDFFINDIHFTGVPDDNVDPPDPPDPPDDDLEQRVSELEENQAAMSAQISILAQQISVLSDLAHEHDGDTDPPVIRPLEIDLGHGDLIVDISAYQAGTDGHSKVDYQALKDSGVVGVLVRASSGKRYGSTDKDGIDNLFWEHIAGCREVGLYLGAYFFLNNEETIESQISRFNDVLVDAFSAGYQFPLGAFYDAEGEFSPQTEYELRNAAEIMVGMMNPVIYGNTELRIDGVKISNRLGIYSGSWWWNAIVSATATWPNQMNLMCWAAWWVPGTPLTQLPSLGTRFGLMNGWPRHKVNYWQFTSTGGLLVGQPMTSLDLNYSIHQVEQQDAVDVLPFIKGTHKTQFDKEYRLASGTTGTETVQIWHLSDVDWLHIKNMGQYWKLGLRTIDNVEYIVFFEDTSESYNRLFAHFQNRVSAIGAPWLPRYMVPGVWYNFPKYVQHYTKKNWNNGKWSGDCDIANGGDVVDRIKLVSKPYTRDYESGKSLEVITLEWSGGEQYDFAGGNVAFRNTRGDNYWFMQWLEGREDKFDKIVKPKCLNLGW